MMDQYFSHLYSFVHTSVLAFLSEPTFHCLYYHKYAGCNDTVHPSQYLMMYFYYWQIDELQTACFQQL